MLLRRNREFVLVPRRRGTRLTWANPSPSGCLDSNGSTTRALLLPRPSGYGPHRTDDPPGRRPGWRGRPQVDSFEERRGAIREPTPSSGRGPTDRIPATCPTSEVRVVSGLPRGS